MFVKTTYLLTRLSLLIIYVFISAFNLKELVGLSRGWRDVNQLSSVNRHSSSRYGTLHLLNIKTNDLFFAGACKNITRKFKSNLCHVPKLVCRSSCLHNNTTWTSTVLHVNVFFPDYARRQDKCKSQTLVFQTDSRVTQLPPLSPKRSSYPCLDASAIHHCQALLESTAAGACGCEAEPEVRVTSLNDRRTREKIDLRVMKLKSKSVDEAGRGSDASLLRPDPTRPHKKTSIGGSDVISEEVEACAEPSRSPKHENKGRSIKKTW